MDAGIATQENIDWLKDHQYPYLVVSRKKHREFDESGSTIVKQDVECTVKVQKVIDEKSGNAVEIAWQRKSAPDTTDTYPGVYCLRTNQADWDEAALWKTYTMLTDLEAVFRSLKSELGLRPVHHQIADRVSGHLFITVLAYHLVHTIRYRLGHAGIHDSWTTLRNILLPHNRVTVSMQCKNGEIVRMSERVYNPIQSSIKYTHCWT